MISFGQGGVCTHDVKVQLYWECHKNFAHLPIFIYIVESNGRWAKEGCNWGHGRMAADKPCPQLQPSLRWAKFLWLPQNISTLINLKIPTQSNPVLWFFDEKLEFRQSEVCGTLDCGTG